MAPISIYLAFFGKEQYSATLFVGTEIAASYSSLSKEQAEKWCNKWAVLFNTPVLERDYSNQFVTAVTA